MDDLYRQSKKEADASTVRSGEAQGKEATGMKIGIARMLFEKYGDDLVSECERLVEVFRAARIRQPLSNANFLHALCLTRVMLRRTVKSFCMLTGGEGGGFVQSLVADFRNMLHRLRENNGHAKIIVVNSSRDECSTLQTLASEFPDCLKVAYAKADSPIRHYIIADNDMVRDEQVHPPLTDDSDAEAVIADVYFRNENIAELFQERFGRQWKYATASA